MNKNKNVAAIIAIILLLLAFFDGWTSGYFTLLRIAVTGTTAYSAWLAYEYKKEFWIWPFVIIAIMFNPVFPIHLKRDTWLVIDLLVAVFLFFSIFLFRGSSNHFT